MREGRDLAFESGTGKLYVLDGPAGRVLRYGSQARFYTNSPPEAVFGKPDLSAGPSSALLPGNLASPNGIEVDSGGHLWVADGNRILRWDGAATRSSGAPADGVLGGADFTSVFPTSDPNRLGFSMRLASDSAGNLYASSSDRNTILRFNAAASKSNGAPADIYFGQLSLVNTTAGLSQSRVSGPRDIVIRGTTLWIHDKNNKRVLRLDNAPTRISAPAFDAVIGQDGFFTTTSTTLSNCSAMDISPGGNLCVAMDAPGRVIMSWPNASALSGLLPAPQYTSGNFSGQGFTAILCETDIRIWAGARESPGSGNVPVLRLEELPATNAASHLGLSPSSPLRAPWQVAVDPASGKVFVSDPPSNSVKRFASVESLASHGPPEMNFTGWLSSPMGICVDNGGRLWVADFGNSRIARWNNAATASVSRAPDGIIAPASFTPPYNETSIYSPYAVTVDAGGTLWMVDNFLARALRYDQAALKSGTVPADGMLGKLDFADPYTGGEPWRYYKPTRAQFDAAGNLWVMDTGGVNESTGVAGDEIRIFRYNNPNSKPIGALPDATIKFSSSTTGAHSFAVTSDNVLWVAQSKPVPRIVRFDNATSVVTGTPASGQLGNGFTGTGASQFGGAINAMSTDAAGNLWVADNEINHRVMRFSANPAPPPAEGRVLSAVRNADGFQFTFTAVADQFYLMESSVDLQAWKPETIVRALTPMETYWDPAPAGARRYFRARRMP